MSFADALGALEASPLGAAIRAGGPWLYATINAAHITGVALLVGAIVVLDLRLMGWRRERPLAALAAGTVPVAGAGLLLALASGACLLATNGSEYAGNPLLLAKFGVIGVGLLNLGLLHRSAAWLALRTREPLPQERPRLALAGSVSLASWVAALLCGRFIAYV